MMSNVVAFPEPRTRKTHARAQTNGPVTLFVHVRRTTLIAHLTGRVPVERTQDERVGKN